MPRSVNENSSVLKQRLVIDGDREGSHVTLIEGRVTAPDGLQEGFETTHEPYVMVCLD
jgi:hypothetical protein